MAKNQLASQVAANQMASQGQVRLARPIVEGAVWWEIGATLGVAYYNIVTPMPKRFELFVSIL